ncbi:MAG: DUF5063 domain-containing protein [Planctomycetes bacterium]|nr:DUF5063 domain-containing protein [Planctomycetota bacterium]
MNLRTNSEIVAFVDSARRYCAQIERTEKTREKWMRLVLESLADLYAAGLKLPSPELPDQDILPSDSYDMTHDEWKKVAGHISAILGELDVYKCYFKCAPPWEKDDDEVTMGTLWVDLTDVYRNVHSGLRAWDAGNDDYVPEIIFEWRFGLDSHWGKHATDAMRALHERVREGIGPLEDLQERLDENS